MIRRTVNDKLVGETISLFPKYVQNTFQTSSWLKDTENIALVNGEGDVALFEKTNDGRYEGHYFFPTSRGRDAITVGKKMLRYLQHYHKEIKVITGLVPDENKPTKWVTRKLGFTSLGSQMTLNGECELFFLPMNKDV